MSLTEKIGKIIKNFAKEELTKVEFVSNTNDTASKKKNQEKKKMRLPEYKQRILVQFTIKKKQNNQMWSIFIKNPW